MRIKLSIVRCTRHRDIVVSKQRVYVEAYAILRLFAEDVDPSEVTRALMLPPDYAHRRGDLRIDRTKKGKVQVCSAPSAGMWSMSSESWVTSPRLQVHIQWILDQIEPKAEALAAVLARGVTGDVYCCSFGRSASPAPGPRSLRNRLGELGLSLQISHSDLRKWADPEESV